MRVDQPRQERPVSQIDHLRARRTLDSGSRFRNLLALHQHLARLDDPPILHIQQPSRMQHNRMGRSSLSLCRIKQPKARQRQK